MGSRPINAVGYSPQSHPSLAMQTMTVTNFV
jgi:hypothetical protein